MALSPDRNTTYMTPLMVALIRRAAGVDDGSHNLERDAQALVTARDRGIPEMYQEAIDSGRIEIVTSDSGR